MKKLFFLLLLIPLFIGCQTLRYIPGSELLLGLDFRPYTEKDFLITPHGYASGEYTTIAMLDYTVLPDARYQEAKYGKTHDGRVVTGSAYWRIEEVSPQALLDSIYQICIEMGADALVDFESIEVKDEYDAIQNPVTIYGVRIKGLAIRRDD